MSEGVRFMGDGSQMLASLTKRFSSSRVAVAQPFNKAGFAE